MTIATPKRSTLALAVLVLLYEEPMHVYRMRQVITQRGEDELVNVVQPNSLYQTVARLEASGLIAATSVTADPGRPERTIYELTDSGRSTMLEWTRALIALPSREYPEFPAALARLAVLAPQDALIRLEARIVALKQELAHIEGRVERIGYLPRLFRLEFDYLRAQKHAELSWVAAVAEEIRTGQLNWSTASVRKAIIELRGRAGPTASDRR
jgi:DNA-binding PadR family transcriptional regulator